MENNKKFILYYSLNDKDTFNIFLPINLESEEDKNLFDHLESQDTDKNNVKLPLTEENFNYLSELKVANFETIKGSSFFKEYKLEEWVL
jgi:hypothetical protein